jgi:maltose alpha-D-glucosyltransferase / alpha-amylase
LLSFCLAEKTFYELEYELNNRPDWVELPLRGLSALLDKSAAPPAAYDPPISDPPA